EQALQFVARTAGVEYSILRVGNPVGRHQHGKDQGLVPFAIRAILSGEPFKIFGDGSNVRDYLNADDAALAILSACRDRAFPNRIWNVGSGEGMSITEVLNAVGKVAGSQVPVRCYPSRSVDVPAIVLDCRRIAAELGWRPMRPFDDTLAEVWGAALE